MIQRIQTLYLIITILLSGSLFFLPLSIKIIPHTSSQDTTLKVAYMMNIYGVTKYENDKPVSHTKDFFLLLLNASTALISIAAIGLYKKRKVQIKLNRLSLLLVTAFMVLDFYFSDAMGYEITANIKPEYQAGSYFPLLQIILLMITTRAIKKDDDLVRSAERIR